MRLPAALLAACSSAVLVPLVAAPALAASAPSDAPGYRPPVVAPVKDRFRPPTARWAAGNRGLDYDVAPATPVTASAAGAVTFAGPVAGSLHVVVLHADGLRTSYSFLRSVAVRRGDRVEQGQLLGKSGDGLHFGVRAGETYIDPALLLGGAPAPAHLVRDDDRVPGPVARERAALVRLLRGVGRLAGGGVGLGVEAALAAGDAVATLWRRPGACTPPEVSPLPRTQRHIAVLVGGLGSSSENAAVDDVDTSALGYAAGDVMRFSYRGGVVAEQPYKPADTGVDMAVPARRLRQLLQRVGEQNPGVPIDILAHSQGGVVARAALAYEFDGLDPELPELGALVTLASPHEGSDMGTVAEQVGGSHSGRLVEAGIAVGTRGGLDPRWESVQQLAVSSPFMRRLNRRPLPAGLPVTSIAARGDLVVTAGRTQLDGAQHVTVSVTGVLTDHGTLPGSAVARREIALGLAGMPPTCQGRLDSVADKVVPAALTFTEGAVGTALWAATERVG